MTKSTHKAEVVPVVLEKHPNADTLSIVRVYGYQVCVRTADWLNVDKAVYVVPDSVVDTTKELFAFLNDGKSATARIKVKKLRGIISYGMLVPAPKDANIGDDVAELYNITRYEPVVPAETGGEAVKQPMGFYPRYDVDAFQRYAKELFVQGEPVHASEKIHGTSFRCVYLAGIQYVGSHGEWKKDSEGSVYWRAYRECENLEKFCRDNPGIGVYGEVFGWVQSLRYGATPGKYWLAVFDILRGTNWVDVFEARDLAKDLPWVPVVANEIEYDFDKLVALASGPSLIPTANHLREGIVIKPVHERTHPTIGRVQLKMVSPSYLEKD